MPDIRETLIDVRRVEWLDAFFATWKFDRRAELFAAIEGLTLDPASLSRGYDLRDAAMWGWGYWLIFLKGWLEYRPERAVDPRNTYVRYMTSVVDIERYDPGIADVLKDPEGALVRIRRRFLDMDAFAACDRLAIPDPAAVGIVEVWLRNALSAEVKTVYEAGTGHAIGPGLVDGHHRMFGARLFGVPSLRARVVVEEPGGERFDMPGRMRALLRFTVPPDASVAVVNAGRAPAELVFARDRAGFPPVGFEERSAEQLVRHLEHGRKANGWQYLLIPASAGPWLDARPELKEHLDGTYRIAVDDPDRCRLYVLWDDDPEAAPRGAPPVELRALSTGRGDLDEYVHGGERTLAEISSLLGRHGYDLISCEAILDFGCGAGRLLRHLPSAGRLVGVDENPYLLAWVAGNLHSVEPRVASWPPLEFEADTFDVVLAVDTLTHFDQDLTFAWMQELVRVTKPGGVIVLTLNGEEGLARLAPELREAFAAGRQVVERPELAGTLACVAHHPAAFVDEVLARGLELLERVPGGEGSAEGLVLLRRPA